jgi:hypothetical protein
MSRRQKASSRVATSQGSPPLHIPVPVGHPAGHAPEPPPAYGPLPRIAESVRQLPHTSCRSPCPTTDRPRALGSLGDIELGVKRNSAIKDYSSNTLPVDTPRSDDLDPVLPGPSVTVRDGRFSRRPQRCTAPPAGRRHGWRTARPVWFPRATSSRPSQPVGRSPAVHPAAPVGHEVTINRPAVEAMNEQVRALTGIVFQRRGTGLGPLGRRRTRIRPDAGAGRPDDRLNALLQS